MSINSKCILLVTLISLFNIPMTIAQHNSYPILYACNYKIKSNKVDIEDLRKDARLSTWAVAQQVDKNKHHVSIKGIFYEYIGTATLIEKSGFLITAAHVVRSYVTSEHQKKELYLIQYLPEGKEYVVKNISKVISIGTDGHTLETAGRDWAILYSPDFSEGISPTPIRLRATTNEPGEAFFVAVTPHLDRPSSYAIEPHDVFYHGLDSMNVRYLELKENHPARLMSGGLVIDKDGFGFGVASVRLDPDLVVTKDDLDADDKKNFAKNKFGIAVLEIDGKWLDDLLTEVKNKSEFNKTLVKISGKTPDWEYFANIYKGPLTLLQLREINENCRNSDSFFKKWPLDLKIRYASYFITQTDLLCIHRDYYLDSDCQRMAAEIKARQLVATRHNDKISSIGTEVMMRTGLDKLDEKNPAQKDSPYRANAYVDLSKVQMQVYEAGDSNAKSRALESLQEGVNRGVSKKTALDTEKLISLKSKDYEAEARVIYEQARLEKAPNKVKKRIARLSELAKLASEDNNSWGHSVTGAEIEKLAKGVPPNQISNMPMNNHQSTTRRTLD